MIPLLLVSDNRTVINNYVDKLKKDSLFFEVTPITKEYSIEDIKNIIKETKVFYPKTRNYFFPDFHLSSLPAQNSFLKLLEEPPSNVQFILSTDNKNRLLSTIISRVKIIKLERLDLIQPDKDLLEILKQLTEQQNLKILNKSQFSKVKKEDVLNLFNQIIIFFRDRLEKDKNSPLAIKEILHLKRLLDSNNLNPQLAIDQALIFIWKMYKMNL